MNKSDRVLALVALLFWNKETRIGRPSAARRVTVRRTSTFRSSEGASQMTLGLVAWGWLSEEMTFHLEPEREERNGAAVVLYRTARSTAVCLVWLGGCRQARVAGSLW